MEIKKANRCSRWFVVFVAIIATMAFSACSSGGGNNSSDGTMTMTTSASDVRFTLAGTGNATVDWGDGSEPETEKFDEEYDVTWFSRRFPDETSRTITISGNNIIGLYCERNQLTALDVSRNPELTELYCYENRLSTLDLSRNTALISLSCGENLLSTLDLSRNTALQFLYYENNQLSSMDLSRNTALIELWSGNNRFTSSALNDLFASLHSIDFEKTLRMSGNPGSADSDPVIAEAKGWTVEGFTVISSRGTLTRFLFEQSFAGMDVSVIYDDYENYFGLRNYIPNIGFSATKLIIYNGSINLLSEVIPESALAILDREELRLLRNTIYARRGMIFQSADLRTHFAQFDWYNPQSNNVDDRLTSADREDIRRIQVFENARANASLSKSDIVSGQYEETIPVPAISSIFAINDDNTIYYNGGGEDNYRGTYRIENGFLVVFVTEQNVGTAVEPRDRRAAEYFFDNNFHWPDGALYREGTVYYDEPVRMVFPVGETVYHDEFGVPGRQIGSGLWWALQ